jgi:D-glycero-beta-D-manno-heptose-7-phosphate kinase
MEGKIDKEKLKKILNDFKSKKVLVVGDIMLDKYIWGDVSRISPEAPVQVVHVIKETFAPGGASNVATNVSSMNGTAFMVGITGDDISKNILVEDLIEKKVNADGIFIDKDKPTTQKVRIIGKIQQLLRVDYEDKTHLHKKIESSIIEYISKVIKEVDVVVIADYAKGVITENVSSHLIKVARENNKAVIVDPKPKHRELYMNATLITPNNLEASQMTGFDEINEDNVYEAGEKLMKYLNSNVLITRGPQGMSLFEKDGSEKHIPTHAKEVYSLIGAGDTVVATIAMAVAAGANFKDAAFLANIAAGIKLGKLGTASVSVDEIKKELEDE